MESERGGMPPGGPARSGDDDRTKVRVSEETRRALVGDRAPRPEPTPGTFVDPTVHPLAADGMLTGAAAYVASQHAAAADAEAEPASPAPPVPPAAEPAYPVSPDLSLEELARVPSHARDAFDPNLDPVRQSIVDALRSVYDPEIPVNIYDIGLIYDVAIDPANNVAIKMTLTSPTCPAAESLPPEVQAKVASIDGINQVDIDLVWEPGWTPIMMSEDARLILNVM